MSNQLKTARTARLLRLADKTTPTNLGLLPSVFFHETS